MPEPRIQETKLKNNSRPHARNNYKVIRQDRGLGIGGGLVLLIHDTVLWQHNVSTAKKPHRTYIEPT